MREISRKKIEKRKILKIKCYKKEPKRRIQGKKVQEENFKGEISIERNLKKNTLRKITLKSGFQGRKL